MPRRSRTSIFASEATTTPLKRAFMACIGLVLLAMMAVPYVVSSGTSMDNSPVLVTAPSEGGGGVRGAINEAWQRPQQALAMPTTLPPTSVDDGNNEEDIDSVDVGSSSDAVGGRALVEAEPSLRTLPDGSKGPCGRVLVFSIPKSGIGSDVLRSIAAMTLARGMRRTFVFSRKNDFPWSRHCPGGRSGWDCFFHNISNCAEPPGKHPVMNDPRQFNDVGESDARPVVKLPRGRNKWPRFWEVLKDLAKGVRQQRVLSGRPDLHHDRYYGKKYEHLGEVREIAHAMWNMRDEFLDKVNERLGALELGSFTAIHIRRGDKKKEARRVPVSKYVKAARKAARKFGELKTVFVMSDDASAVKEARAQLSGVRVVTLVPATAKGFNSKGFRASDTFQGRSKLESAVELLTDLEAARRATVFIGTGTSNLGVLVQLLRSQQPGSAIDVETGRAIASFRSVG